MAYERVKYRGCTDGQVMFGGNDDPRGVLRRGGEYRVEFRLVGRFHSQVKLVGRRGLFNTVCFEGASCK